MNRNLIIILIVFLSLLTFKVSGQIRDERTDNYVDSTFRFKGIVPPVEFQYNFDEVFSEPFANQFTKDLSLSDDPSTIWLSTELLLSNNSQEPGSNIINTHFTSPLYQQHLKDSEFNMVRYILGAAQASAVAYMAYKHIKKYGFWK